MIVCGAVLMAVLVYTIGVGQLWSQLRTLGWALGPFILLEGVAELFHTQGWRHCLSDAHRGIPFSRIFLIRMVGLSINRLTPTAGLGGEVTKGVLLASDRTGPESAAGVIIDKLSYALAQLLFVVVGSVATFPSMHISHEVFTAMLAGTLLLSAGIFGFLILQHQGKLGAFMRLLARHHIGGRHLDGAARSITEVDQKVTLFYRNRPADLPLSIIWHILGMACGILQSFYFLSVLTDQASWTVASGVWFLGTWFNLMSFALPVDLGVMEVARVMVFKAFGLHPVLGLTYGIALRLEQVFWSGVGLLIYAVLTLEIRKRAASEPER
jgi:uncharacterized protein (TIRG00374 family)